MYNVLIKSLRSLDDYSRADLIDHNQPEVSDYDLNDRIATRHQLTPAAVLVPLIKHPQDVSVLLIQRTEHLNDHAGQISFPGGKAEPGDKDPIETALRETEEEIGITDEHIQIIGLLDDYETVTKFRITPVVSMVEKGFNLALDSFEVSEAFEVPLDFIFNPLNHQICSRSVNGIERYFYVFEYKDHYIWGATAGMLMNLYQRVTKTVGQGLDKSIIKSMME
jgi:8-oxo-dGTP pyrophosphatase MutT (NUDIX family)